MSDDAAPVANAAAVAAASVPVAEPVADAAAEVGDAVLAVLAVRATLATEAMDEEAAARRLGDEESAHIHAHACSDSLHPPPPPVLPDASKTSGRDGTGRGRTHGSAAVQNCVTWFCTGGFSLLSGQLL